MLAFLLATWFGCGRSPCAPGTAGSAAALAIAIALHRYAGFAGWHFLLLAAALFFPAVWAAGVAARVARSEGSGLRGGGRGARASGSRWPARARSTGKAAWPPSRCSACSISGSRRRCGNWKRCRADWASTPTTPWPASMPHLCYCWRDASIYIEICLSGNHPTPGPRSRRCRPPPPSPAASCRFAGRALRSRTGRASPSATSARP